ncbi:MAG TPA: 5-(carboxyamino)imidazole ribonucleotide mutase [Acidobacteriota bacterium]|nr:5-(carboxyamino)imidazole ribonucleotide mutase [Acidobacteriota bacterium]MED5559377.1 5-(carboxyamino)imidazole ribonucleotide mutase [Acidobacteriota bacterium]MEE3152300.1 5-(carboxyamino)imidazole ribonucleotide mutase [Acidobacteriota bacterium]HJN48276.1 5-(carboxyamino)imidazole ribonucleotide mutase [Acidobacteriota bacterium]
MSSPQVAMVMGSGSDLDVMMNGIKVLKGYGIEYEVRVISAHRAPDAVGEYARAAASRGIKVLIAGAGAAAHLAGALAAHSALPIIGVPLVASSLGGFDALLATVQMPGGVPVGTVGVGKAGAVNAAHLAARIIAISDEDIARKVADERASQIDKVIHMDSELQERLEEEGL